LNPYKNNIYFRFERARRLIDLLPNATLYIPTGTYLTGPFNMTSHMTIFLEKDAKIIGSDDEKLWPIIPFLPSYGRGRLINK